MSGDNQNENTACENLWKADKVTFIVINIYIKKKISIKQPNIISQWMKKQTDENYQKEENNITFWNINIKID